MGGVGECCVVELHLRTHPSCLAMPGGLQNTRGSPGVRRSWFGGWVARLLDPLHHRTLLDFISFLKILMFTYLWQAINKQMPDSPNTSQKSIICDHEKSILLSTGAKINETLS